MPPSVKNSTENHGIHDAAIEVVLDLRGLWCPQPVLRAKKALRDIPVGGALVLHCTDPLTEVDIPNFVAKTGQLLQRRERQGELHLFTIIRQR